MDPRGLSQAPDRELRSWSDDIGEGDAGPSAPSLRDARIEETDEESESEDGPTYEALRTFTSTESGQKLARIASALSYPTVPLTPERPRTQLERKDTLAGVKLGDPVLDPTKPEFNFYKWVRMFMKLMEEDGIKHARTGITFKNLSVSGSGAAVHLQHTVASPLTALLHPREYFNIGRKSEVLILKDFNGTLKEGELLIVLGRPGSGCSTFLKCLCGQLQGLSFKPGSTIHYNGVDQATFKKELRGEAVYSGEEEKHFPHLTVGQTLNFAAAARTPSARVKDVPRKTFSTHLTQVAMAVFGLSHTKNTKVGDDYIRGVSGGERKRVSIAELALAGSPVCCWDNSTRGLDAATALEFAQALRIGSRVAGMTQALAIYQASQAIYDLFDKAIVLYEGRQIYYGPAKAARKYFEDIGWYCPPRQTTGDFLTAVTNPQERKPREGFESKVPRTSEEFERYWQQSEFFRLMQAEMEEVEEANPPGGPALDEMRAAHHQAQAKRVPSKSPYTISLLMQIRLCTKRAYQRMWNDKASTITTIFSQIIMALIIGSIFFNTPQTTDSFFSKGSVLFFAILLNALMSITEINGPIVAKHFSFAFYHAFCEALAGIIADIPVKFVTAVAFNIVIYFLGGLRRAADAFFIFFLFTFITMLSMSAIFRTLAAATKAITQALALAGVMVLAIVIYTGFMITKSFMHPWFKWINYINPVGYAFESILVNEVHNQRFECSNLIPPYGTGINFQCPVAGAVAGERTVSGDAWALSNYDYSYAHLWRNLGILFGYLFFFWFLYLAVTEINLSTASTADYLVFRRGHVPKSMQENVDEEKAGASPGQVGHNTMSSETSTSNATDSVAAIPPQKDIFTWRNVVYDITIKGEPRRLLDNVSGWVRPGTLTALMGVSGAGKTTLLDALAQRISTGVITGEMLVNGKPLDPSFQRKTGYVQQQDLHLETTTVREALQFSAILRQPKSVSRKAKYEYVEEVIKMLNMEDFAEAVVGTPGEGLNVEQRKLLTIGVELAAKPALLLFLDEPTSGLDSQSSWSIVQFLRKLANSGQAVLSTIHQPSAILFQEFDRLLFLAKGGKTVYFGDIGENSKTLLSYFERNGAEPCGQEENPAEYMLNIVGAGPSGHSAQDWPTIWKNSPEAEEVQAEIDRIHAEKAKEQLTQQANQDTGEFAMPFRYQLLYVTHRVFQQYWRTPSYIYGKLILVVVSSLFIGFTFYLQNNTTAGLQNTLFSIFMLTTIFSTLVQQIMPRFVTQRSLFEVRERPSRAYTWKAFLLANIIVELPYQALLGVLAWACLYWPVFGVGQSALQRGLFVIYSVQFYLFTSTFAHMVIAGLPDAETGGHIATTLFSLMLTFNGVLQPPDRLPGFWIFMYRVSPLTYTVGGLAAVGLHGRQVRCARNEMAIFDPPSGSTCGQYMQQFFAGGGLGVLNNPNALADCQFCPLSDADQFLAGSRIFWGDVWRNFGIGWAYIGFNIVAAIVLYHTFRVHRPSKRLPKRAFLKAKHYAEELGDMGRTLFTSRLEKTPSGKENINERLY
ncbi:hypothetical protein VTO42DRAFT_7052 [Malbranchea cinnamomea]